MIDDIQAVQNRLENRMIAEQDSIRKVFQSREKQGKTLVLQNYVNSRAEMILKEWNDLAYRLIAKYNDGYIKPDSGGMLSPGYPEEWKQRIIEQDPQKHLIPEWNKEGRQKDNPF